MARAVSGGGWWPTGRCPASSIHGGGDLHLAVNCAAGTLLRWRQLQSLHQHDHHLFRPAGCGPARGCPRRSQPEFPRPVRLNAPPARAGVKTALNPAGRLVRPDLDLDPLAVAGRGEARILPEDGFLGGEEGRSWGKAGVEKKSRKLRPAGTGSRVELAFSAIGRDSGGR